MENWDDLRILLAVAENGSITAGAAALRVDQSTVSRRLAAFERRLGRRLFEDGKARDRLTPFGAACAHRARRMAEETARLDQDLRREDRGLDGDVTVRAGDILSDRLLLSVCAGFLDAFPKINLRISRQTETGHRFETDVALFATNAPEDGHVGRKLATATFAAYAAPAYRDRFARREAEMAWVNWDDGSPTPTWPALAPAIPNDAVRLRCASVDTLLAAAKMGLGATVLPCFIGEPDPDLVRLHPGRTVSRRDVWVFVQPDLRAVPKIRAFLDHLYAQIAARADVVAAN